MKKMWLDPNLIYKKINLVVDKTGVILPITFSLLVYSIFYLNKHYEIDIEYIVLAFLVGPFFIFLLELSYLYNKIITKNTKKFFFVLIGVVSALVYFISEIISRKLINSYYGIEPELMEYSVKVGSFVVFYLSISFILSFIFAMVGFFFLFHVGILFKREVKFINSFIRCVGSFSVVAVLLSQIELVKFFSDFTNIKDAGVYLDFNSRTVCESSEEDIFTKLLPGNKLITAVKADDDWVFSLGNCFHLEQ